ncbi:MAG TPA: zinc ribbon domain-containing protein [Paraburkholderia sp.]|uniref:zinc ribbon domain-containing protein n=1 Tax=Paraburkholderia sp. TaxID=1926495 RepID=UPI002B477663|nr:zinc ribbon domain-containing protein [Paraburkholderia sp.]HKR41642.1 zinc ribbon domain-containing protein [Paraburkholderia sp.]
MSSLASKAGCICTPGPSRPKACVHSGVCFDEVDERCSAQTCICCNRRTGPKCREGLGIREWACGECGAYHHRNINAAVNLLAAGCRRLAE